MDPEQVEREKERLKARLEQRRAEKKVEDEQRELDREKERRESARLLQEAQKKREDELRAREMQQAREQKHKDAKYQEQLRAQVRREREAREAREAASASASKAPTRISSSSNNAENGEFTLKLRLPDGKNVVEKLPATAMLADLRTTVVEKFSLSAPFFFRSADLAHTFTADEEQKPVSTLGIAARSTLFLIDSATAGQANVAAASAPQRNWWEWSTSLISSFFTGSPPQATESSTVPYASGAKGGGKVIHVHSKREYQELRARPGLVVVDFSATWCGPCKAIAPTYEAMADVNPSVTFLHVDVDEMRGQLDDLSDVRGVPTFKFFKGGRLVHSFSGASKANLEQGIRSYK